KRYCATLADLVNCRRPPQAAPVSPKDIPVAIDDDGTGAAVAALLREEEYTVQLIGAGTAALNAELDPRRRDGLGVHGRDRARAGKVYLLPLGVIPGLGIDAATLRRLKAQLIAVTWSLDSKGRRVVEPKKEIKKKLGRSPDDADAFNLAQQEYAADEIIVLGG